jgi:acyl-CoA synthetase (AMP-forming)/AMP-acid ligase II
MTIYDRQLDKTAANFVALSPVSFVERSAEVFGDLPAVIHGHRCYNWAQTRERSARLAAALKTHGIGRGQTVSAMLACAVVAKPDAKWGETPLACVETQVGSSVTAADLVAHCRHWLANYKVPKGIRFVDIPKTLTDKIQKFQLRQRACADAAFTHSTPTKL